jgi:hypothetical protein
MITHLRNPRLQRGSALLMVTVLLGVLAVIGVAAVTLGSQERTNAGAKGKRDTMAACADAARMLIWAEVAKYSTARLRSPLTEARVTLGSGTTLSAPAHYASSAGLQVVDLSYFNVKDPVGGDMTIDCTNSYCGDVGLGGKITYAFVARCRDARGRETEVEFDTMLMF